MSYKRYVKWVTPDFDGIVDGMFCCPCCGYPTLTEWWAFQICTLCWWQDDGTGESKAEFICGGPNGSYSLREAQKNFEDHGDMYRYDTTRIKVVTHPSKTRSTLLLFIQGSDGVDHFDASFYELLKTR